MQAVGMFVAAATALLGSPGPGIAALLAVGRSQGWSGGLRFYAGLQAGLAMVVLASGAGLVALLAAYPSVTRLVTIGATIYLVYLAYSIATSPIAANQPRRSESFSPYSGLLLGLTNPKAYLAMSSLLASPLQLASAKEADIELKMALCMAVILSVDLIWLWCGVTLGRAKLAPTAERIVNISMGVTILIAAVFFY